MRVAVVLISAVLAFHLVRSAAVATAFDDRPAWAAALWPGHPRILTDRGMAAIGLAAAQGRPASPATMRTFAEIARRSPLSAEPFLAAGAMARMNGSNDEARRLFEAAKQRDPRSRAARFFLAQQRLEAGDIQAGLAEMLHLVRLQPRAADPFAPALADYAKTDEGGRELTRFLRTRPDIKDMVLGILAQDAANAPVVFRIAGPGPHPPTAATHSWQRTLVTNMADAGRYDEAFVTWKSLTGAAHDGLLFNPDFRDAGPPPPFNWILHEGKSGLAESAPGGGLNVLHFGRDTVTLASQMLRLPAGTYTFSYRTDGSDPGAALRWRLTCLPDNRPMAELPLRQGTNVNPVVVPENGCGAQVIELQGLSGESPRQTEVLVSGLRLTPGARP